MDTNEEKKMMRRRIKAMKAQMGGTQKAEEEAAIWKHVTALPQFVSARTVLAYSAMPDEVATDGFISLWSDIKEIVLPVVDGDRLILRRYDAAKLKPGYRGILEPSEEADIIPPEAIDLAIIPGMAFDEDGHRLGRGGGFYDRLIPQLHCPLIGICFSCQLVPSVPVESFDQPLDQIIHP